MPDVTLKSSVARCSGVPLPGEEYVISPGLALASLTNSGTVFTGSEGLTRMTCGTAPIIDTGWKSRTVS